MYAPVTRNWIAKPVSWLAWGYLTFCGWTNRFEKMGSDPGDEIRRGDGLILAFWHNRQAYPLYYYRNSNVSTLVSQSRDGEIITQVIYRFGLKASRGSSSRAAVAGLMSQIRFLNKGVSVAFTPDGPRGPNQVAKPGIVELAKLSGKPIIPVAFSSSRHIRFRGWDAFMLPLPFGTVRMVVGNRIPPPPESTSDLIQDTCNKLTEEMNRITEIADQIIPKKRQPTS